MRIFYSSVSKFALSLNLLVATGDPTTLLTTSATSKLKAVLNKNINRGLLIAGKYAQLKHAWTATSLKQAFSHVLLPTHSLSQ